MPPKERKPRRLGGNQAAAPNPLTDGSNTPAVSPLANAAWTPGMKPVGVEDPYAGGNTVTTTPETAPAGNSVTTSPIATPSGNTVTTSANGNGSTPNGGNTVTSPPTGNSVTSSPVAPIGEFAHRPRNARQDYEYDVTADPELASLSGSIATYGLLQAVTVCSRDAWLHHNPGDGAKIGDAPWVVLMGNRRLAAARAAGLTELPYFRADALADPNRVLEAGISENYHRKDTDPILEAVEFHRALTANNESRRQLAARLRVSHVHIGNRLNLLNLIAPFQTLVSRGVVAPSKALPIAALEDKEQERLLELGEPYNPTRLHRPVPTPVSGNTVTTRKALHIPKAVPAGIVAAKLRDSMDPEMLDEVVKLLTDPSGNSVTTAAE
jgi:ParB family chromosome partitioning protein